LEALLNTTSRVDWPMPGALCYAIDLPIIVGMYFLAPWLAGAAHGASIDAHLVICLLGYGLVHRKPNSPWSWQNRTLRLDVVTLVGAWFAVLGITLLAGQIAAIDPPLARESVLIWAVSVPLLQALTHYAAQRIRIKIGPLANGEKGAAIVGVNRLSRYVEDRLREATLGGGPRFHGYFDDRSARRVETFGEINLLGQLSDVARYVKAHGIGVIYVVIPIMQASRIQNLISDLADTTVSVNFVPDIFVFDLMQGQMEDHIGIPTISVIGSSIDRASAVTKRIFDVIFSSIVLLTGSPLLLLISLGVKLDSSGPVLFRQRRYGLDGEEFRIIKFRTMSVMEDGDGIRQATLNDPRVTRIGSFLRRTSLDELPQFFNVLLGEMSVVGPRPHANSQNESYRRLVRGYMIRHIVKPGLTGWAQVNGYRGETKNIEQMESRVRYDLDYIRNWSLALDLRIILKTVRLLLGDRAAS
jgi:putative colanic acid biosynthesis UDP-glucose lipid carrier transferase